MGPSCHRYPGIYRSRIVLQKTTKTFSKENSWPTTVRLAEFEFIWMLIPETRSWLLFIWFLRRAWHGYKIKTLKSRYSDGFCQKKKNLGKFLDLDKENNSCLLYFPLKMHTLYQCRLYLVLSDVRGHVLDGTWSPEGQAEVADRPAWHCDSEIRNGVASRSGETKP